MNMRTNIILVLATFLMLIGDALASEVVKCPTKNSDTKIFQIPSMFQTSVSIESTSDKSNPISLATYRSVGNGKCDRHIVAEYSVEGGNPNVDSLFFYKYNKKLNIITIVHWDINHRGIGTYGRLYQIYAYEKNANDQFE